MMRGDARKRTMHPLIGLSGRKRSGKDTFAGSLVDDFGFTRFAFADPLKEAALHLNPLVEVSHFMPWVDDSDPANADWYIERLSVIVDSDGWEVAKEIPEVRRILQEYGIAIRAIDPDFWLRATMEPVAEARKTGPVVITDVRFPNEFDAVQAAGGRCFRLSRPEADVVDDGHVSEVALDTHIFDAYIANEGGLVDLRESARRMMRYFFA